MKINDTALGIGMTSFSIIGFLYVQSLNFTSEVGLSPGVFPQFIFALMLICGLALMWEARSHPSADTQSEQKWAKFVLTVLALVIYAYALEYLGFIISTTIFLAVTIYIFEEKRWKILLSVPLATAFSIYYTFTELFLIPLP